MLIIWQGLGFLAILIPILISALVQATSDSIFEHGFYTSHPMVQTVALFIAAAAVWLLGARLNDQPGQILVDPKTGQQFEFKKKHTLFWIPMQWFSAVIAAIAMVVAFK